MRRKVFERRFKEDRPVIAICYDFDKTLSPDDMQAQGYIQSVGYDVDDFWRASNTFAEEHEMDQNLAYMHMMVQESKGHFEFNKQKLLEYGAKVQLFPGVADWFERIRAYGEQKGVIIEHYIISCGLKEMIEGTEIARNGAFEKIYACSFYFDESGVAQWPAYVVNYTNKTQFLFRIEKGVLDINDHGVNDYFAPEDIRVPFRNMVYIGDSDTDVPCMKLVDSHGGHAIGVYDVQTKDKAKVHKMMRDGRIRYFAPADYTDGSQLDTLIKRIIDRTVGNEALEAVYYACKRDTAAQNADAGERAKMDLLVTLEESQSLSHEHALFDAMRQVTWWTTEEQERLIEIVVNNRRVQYLLEDAEVRAFCRELLGSTDGLSKNAVRLKELIDHWAD